MLDAGSNCLPFPRGDVADLGDLSWDSTVFGHLVGRKFVVNDTQHGTGSKVVLRVCRAEAAITVARKCVNWGTDAKDFGRTVQDLAPTAGKPTLPIDDAYAASAVIVANSLFYCVEYGPCYVVTESSAVNLAQQDAVAADSAGCVNGAAAAAGEAPFGIIDEDSTDKSTNVLIWVTGLSGVPAAG